MAAERYRIGEFEFDAESGELRRDGAPPERLAPQPARLLALLAERGGGLVGRDEIREALWSGVEIDFDTGLHFCVRQVRAALGDTADAPRYVETLPRRGYRLKAPVAPVVPAGPALAGARRSATGILGAVGLLAAAVLALAAIAAIVGLLGGRGSGAPSAGPPRVGILPTVPPAGDARFAGAAPIADRVLDALEAEIAAGRLAVVGPTGTAPAFRPDRPLREVARELDVEHLVHVRFVPDAEPPFLLVELIRADDGAHVWVRRYDGRPDAASIGSEAAREIARRLDLNGIRTGGLAPEAAPD